MRASEEGTLAVRLNMTERLQVAIRREVAGRLRQAAARRDLTVRQYVVHAIEERVHADLAGADAAIMTPRTDPVLGALWNNPRDAAYDRF
jgi:hypothetical protein